MNYILFNFILKIIIFKLENINHHKFIYNSEHSNKNNLYAEIKSYKSLLIENASLS